ncbi:uncharacterized protein LY89DRAFT_777678 [Mollisia scopiformis]|uniref:Sodium/calcium exchanger membrane region domain-containing protein n=1 Tax=Mollisia scopiformis TaxID=149040 RepID=A0A194XQQ0_MOLSC|nr:uncharacterized protein LY89DRAFT_777678 [Mollisia scopiformis]KUJ22600.1 hypothetical protein LY89DRAFT_777678 [Mollisia scopiformis]
MQQISLNALPRRTLHRKFRFQAFYITVLCLCLFTVISLVADQSAKFRHGTQYGVAQRRALEELDVTRLVKRDEECRLVHHAEDKCAFIKANCPDEEAGLFSYLSLYYCSLPKAKPVAFTILSLWLALLFTTIGIAASDFFCINLSTIASILGMSESMAGVTFLAFGNGSPDVFSTFAAMSSHSGSLAIGELIGAAGFITAVVAGSMALVREFKVGKKTFVRDVGFFIIAASFSMVFLADGRLHMWECSVMVGFYLFYVVIVVLWHWYLGQRRRRRERDAAARGHYLAATNEELEVSEEDSDDEDAPAGERRTSQVEDFGALERGGSPLLGPHVDDESDDGDEGRQLAAEMASSMRVTRPSGHRRNTITPIRPSLVGALEFRSVLSSLQKSRGSHRPIHLRRYSDDPTSQYDGHSSEPEPYSDHASSIVVTAAEDQDALSKAGPSTRTRAVSMNDAAIMKPTDPAAFSVAKIPDIGIVAATPTFPRNLEVPASDSMSGAHSSSGPVPPSPTFSLSPPPSFGGSREVSPAPSRERPKRDTLAPPDEGFPGARHLRVDFFKDHPESAVDSPQDSPKSRSRPIERPRLTIPNSASRDSSHSRILSPVVPFPAYTDSPLPMSAVSSRAPSLVLPEATMTPESLYNTHSHDLEYEQKPIKWWPYRWLPSPHTLASTLFPTLYTWREKSIWDKFVSVVSAPSIFLLAVTLPVVESESKEDESDEILNERQLSHTSHSRSRSGTIPMLVPDSPSLEAEPEWIRYRRATDPHSHPRSPQLRGYSGHNTAAVAVTAESSHHNPHSLPLPSKQNSIGHIEGTSECSTLDSSDWNRWLVAVQIFTAPLFVMIIVWANDADGDARLLVQMVMYSLLGSLVAFAVLLLTTTPTKPPKYRFLLCFLGFVVAIAWISTIANEVVGVLKAIGVILGISDAILGLTIFAVGNSLGDLVADITVARLGYPVMALSACFGGPMLNILLGIGLSGLYMTITQANSKHAKHPDKKLKYKPYEIEVSGTLMVSGITLLVTLVGLLIAVPMNKWIMSRRIGWGLIILWSVSTVVNLAVELSGVWGETS